MINQMLPNNVCVVVAETDMWITPLTTEEELLIAGAVDKRQREFRAGRNAAKQAIRQLGYNNLAIIMKGEDRKPIWPKGIVGSITHTEGRCIAAAAYSKDYIGIGIDIERKSPLELALVERICTYKEQAWIKARQRKNDETPWCKVIFSIKESIYKLFNPIHQVYLGFLEAEIIFSRSENSFKAEIFHKQNNICCNYTGYFGLDDGFIYSAVIEMA